MVMPETRKFVEENRHLLEFVAKHGSPEIRKIAAALLLAVDLEKSGDKNESKRIC